MHMKYTKELNGPKAQIRMTSMSQSSIQLMLVTLINCPQASLPAYRVHQDVSSVPKCTWLTYQSRSAFMILHYGRLWKRPCMRSQTFFFFALL